MFKKMEEYLSVFCDVSESSIRFNYDGEYAWINYYYVDKDDSDEINMFAIAFNNCIDKLLKIGVKYYCEEITDEDWNELSKENVWRKSNKIFLHNQNNSENIMVECDLEQYREIYVKIF
jgi:hypothetical protein